MIFLGIPLVYWLVGGGALALAGCSPPKPKQGFPPPPEEITPPGEPPPERVVPNPPGGALFECVPPEQSFLLMIRGYNQSHPRRGRDEAGNATSELTPSETKPVVCSIWDINRLGAAQGQPTGTGTPVRTFLQWSNRTTPFPAWDSTDFDCALLMEGSRTGEDTLDHVYRGCPPPATSDIWKEGSWGEILTLAGLPDLGNNVSFSLVADMIVETMTATDPNSCRATIDLWQAVRRVDGLELAQTPGDEEADPPVPPTPLPIVLPLYREEACASAEAIDDAPETPSIVLCDEAAGNPCPTLGMTHVDKLEARLITLPYGMNSEEAAAISGMSFNAYDESLAVLEAPVSFSIPIPARAISNP